MAEEAGGQSNDTQPKGDQPGIPVRLGCGSIIVFTILCSIFVLAIVNLVVYGEIDIQRGDLEGYRVWLVREDGIKGLGFSSSREVDLNTEPNTTCIQTKVKFLEWRSKGETGIIEYCECYVSHQGEWVFSSECPP